jgi:translocation and assembly module TamB
MRAIGRALRCLGTAFAAIIVVLLIGFGVLQTRAGHEWLADAIARATSTPDFAVSIEGVGCFVPFRVRVDRISLADVGGTYLTLHRIGFAIAPAELLTGRLHIRWLRVAEIDMARPSSAPARPLSDYLHVPHLPVAVALDRLAIARLSLMPAVLGESVAAAVEGSAVVEGGTAHAALDLHRIDGIPGKLALTMALSGSKPLLSLRLDASEPTGILLGRLLGPKDRLPFAVSLAGTGPVMDWHGRLTASAGADAHLDADIALATASETALGLSGTAALAPLLPTDFATIVGDRASFAVHAQLGQRILANRLTVEIAAGTVTGDSHFDRSEGAIAAHLRANMPDLARLSGVVGAPLHGAASLSLVVTGSRDRPVVKADLSGTGIDASGSATEHVEAHVSAVPNGPLENGKSRIGVAAKGRIDGLVIPQTGAFTRRLSQGIDWSFAGIAARDASTIDVTRFSAQGGGLDLSGSGHLVAGASGISGRAQFAGSEVGVRTGIAAADALIGGKAVFAGAVRREPTGAVDLANFTLNSAAAELSGDAHFDPASHRLAAMLALDILQLKPLGAALGTKLDGAASARVEANGATGHLRVTSEIDGRGIGVAGVAIERLQLSGTVADLSRRQGVIDGSFRAVGLDGTIALAAEPNGDSELVVPRLRLTAGDTTIDSNLRIALASGLVQGSLTGRIPDLGRWSGLVGTPLRGSLDLTARLAASGAGQGLYLSATGTRLAAGANGSRIEIGRLGLTARLADLLRAPAGTGQLSLRAARSGAADFATATATVSSRRPGRFDFAAVADGHPLSLALAGEGGVAPGEVELRLTRLSGSLGDARLVLEQPLNLSRRGADLSLAGLAFRLGPGRVSGSAAIRGEALSVTLNAADLPIAPGAQLIGYPGARGALTLQASLGGTLGAPQGHAVLNVSDLSLAASPHSAAPKLGLTAAGDWNGRIVGLHGRVTGLGGDRISFAGSLPMVLTRAPLRISVPPQGPLALRLQGGGDIGHLADLLPLGEDRLSGRFAADAAVGGTVASPAASGALRLTGARYENFASGAQLTNLEAVLVGDRDRFRLASLSAGDGAGGTLTAQGSVVLSGASGPAAELSATLADFRVAARDEVLATATGNVAVTGPLAAPDVAAALTIDRADITLPDSLPPSVIVLKVTEIDGKRQQLAPPLAAPAPASALPMSLDITLALPGQVFVRGHGLNSDWHGRLKIAGTSAAPQIAGVLVARRGSVDLLGKSFLLTRGEITFDGSAKLDPALDIVAEANAADITAQVIISGYASAPKITLASTPAVPQDEILSRILFNQGLGQITAGQGVQLAQAAATLAGGGPGVLDRLRGKLGLDWLGFGQGPAGAASPILNPSVVTPTSSSTTAVSAGKYIAPGVSVGVTQGVSPPTSKVTVEVDLGHHVTVDTEAGQNGGTGVGLNYKYDY